MMQNLSLNRSDYTPSIDFNAETGECAIQGECLQILQGDVKTVVFLQNQYDSEVITITDVSDFFQLIFDWLSAYIENVGGSLEFHFDLVYMDTYSSRRVLELFSVLEAYKLKKNGEVSVFWHYAEGDLDALETGEEYADEVQIDFTFVPYEAQEN
jgi:hypothetical protein